MCIYLYYIIRFLSLGRATEHNNDDDIMIIIINNMCIYRWGLGPGNIIIIWSGADIINVIYIYLCKNKNIIIRIYWHACCGWIGDAPTAFSSYYNIMSANAIILKTSNRYTHIYILFNTFLYEKRRLAWVRWCAGDACCIYGENSFLHIILFCEIVVVVDRDICRGDL